MAAAASNEEPTHAAQVPPLRLRGLPLLPAPPARPPARTFPSVTSMRLARQSMTSRSAHRGKKRLTLQEKNTSQNGTLLLPPDGK